MTATVRKGAGRAAHSARTAKHAQRSPLPPRGVTQTEARTHSKAMTADIIKETAVTAAVRKTKTATKTTAKSPKRTVKAVRPLGAKAAAFAAYAKEAGWEIKSATHEGETDTVTVSHDGQEVCVTLVGNKQIPEFPPTYTTGTRQVKLRNVSAARQQVSNPPANRPVKDRSVGARKTRVHDDAEVRTRLPFDIETASDQAILDAIAGKKVVWRSALAEITSEERVPVESRTLRIDQHNSKTGPSNRIVTFIGATGYVSVRLSNLIRVSR